MSYLEKNLEIIKEKHPLLWKSLEKSEENLDHDLEIAFTSNRPNLIWTDRSSGKKSLIHGIDPDVDAEQALKSYQIENASVLVIFGLGLGYVLKAYLANRPHTNFSIFVIEKNKDLFLKALETFDWARELNDSSITWVVEPDLAQLSNHMIDFFIGHTTVDRNLKILATNSLIQLDEAYYASAGRMLMDTRDHCVLLVGNSVNDQMLGFTNTMDNLDLVMANPGFSRLEGKFEGRLCISVAAGPSVNEHWDVLKSLQGKIPIIACDTLLKPMSDRGIYPDFITALERDDYVPKLFRNIHVGDRSTLIAPNLLMRETFDCFKGEKIIYTPSPLYNEALGLGYLGRFHPGSSAGNLNLAAAAYMGFKTIIMVGHNLAYGFQTNETHAAGTIDPDRERSRSEEELVKESRGLRVATQDGKDIVWTRVEWNYFRKQMEGLFATHSECRWINTAPKGAMIRGAELMSFSEALKEFYIDDFDIGPEKKKLLYPVSTEALTERYRGMRKGFGETLESLKKWNAEAHRLFDQIKKWEKKIQDKELDGKYVSTSFLDSAIDEVLKLKVESVNEDKLFYMMAITILMPFHATFERIINQMRAEYKDDYSLKKDFLLKHEKFFETWLRQIPKIIQRLEERLCTIPSEFPLTEKNEERFQESNA